MIDLSGPSFLLGCVIARDSCGCVYGQCTRDGKCPDRETTEEPSAHRGGDSSA